MNLTTEQRAIVQAKVDAHNAANPAEQLTVETMLDGIAMRQVAAWEAEHVSTLRTLMTTTADKIIAASGGDMTKLAEAVQAGEAAALATLTA
jgi:hypothetical protein